MALPSSPLRDESGQVAPALLVVVVATLALGLMLMQTGQASSLKAQAATAADAAALAGARALKSQATSLIVNVGLDGGESASDGLNAGNARNAARGYAARNGGRLTDFQVTMPSPSTYHVHVTVESEEGLSSTGSVGVDGRTAVSEATAELAVTFSLGGGAMGGGGGLGPEELASLESAAGTPVRTDSALRVYAGQTCGDGVDTDRLAQPVKVAIVRAEAVLGFGLRFASAYRSVACQAAIGNNGGLPVAPPGASLHNVGLALDVADSPPGTRNALAAAAADPSNGIALCRSIPSEPWHFSHSQARECAGRSGDLTGGAFGGDAGSVASFEIRLVE